MARLVVAAVSILVLASGCSLSERDTGDSRPVDDADYVFDLIRPSPKAKDEEPYGLAGASAEGTKTRVVIAVDDPPRDVMNAEIRRGDCLGQIGGPEYALGQVLDGDSESVVDVSLDELLERGYVVFVGDWDDEGQLCGDFFGAEEN